MKNINILLMAILLLASISCGDDKIKPHPGGSPLTDEVIFEQVGKIESIGLIEHYELLIQKTTYGIYVHAGGRYTSQERTVVVTTASANE